jgi:hypothetical protein
MCVDPDSDGLPRSRGKRKAAPDNLASRVRRALEERTDDGPRSGGLTRRLSPCCGAAIDLTTGGVIMEICSKCGGPAEEPRIGGS